MERLSALKAAGWRVEGGIARLVGLSQGVFDDFPDHEQTFWGIGATRKSPRFKQGQLGFYYLGLDRARSIYAQGIGWRAASHPGCQSGPGQGRDSTSIMTQSFSGEAFPALLSGRGLSQPKRATGFRRGIGSRASASGQTSPRETKTAPIPGCRPSTRSFQEIVMLEPLDCWARPILPT